VNKGKPNCYDYEEQYDRSPEKREEKKEHKCKLHEETVTILKCGTSSGSAPMYGCGIGGPVMAGGAARGAVPNGAAAPNSVVGNGIGGGYGCPPTIEAAVTLDTRGLEDTTIKIDFSSLISFKTFDADNFFLHLTFKLKKICGGAHIPLGTWTFEKVSYENEPSCGYVQETDPFCFTWCECDDDCGDCCRYIVELVDEQAYNVEFVVVTNIALTALAVGKKRFCK
jgi:hypothetical protein